MSKEKRRVPKLRFPGFTEDWEQRKLSDISTKVTTKNIDVHYTETLTNSAEQGIISQVDFFDKEISNKDNINGYYIVENNDFIYNPRISTLAPVGPINRNKLNRTGIMSPLYTVFRASNVDLDFLEWYFQSSHWHRYMKLNGDSGARADRIAIKDSTFFDMPIKTPVNIKEQVLIGETLEKFNQYITLHQRKLNNLKLKKKALLQKLFPKNGERYPELRFPGFTDAWEQRKLSDISTKVTTKNIDVHYTETLTNSAEQGIISQVDFFDKEISNKDNINGYYIVENNDFIYNPRISTLAPVGPINRNKLNRTGIMSPLYTVFRASNVDLDFLEWYFQSSHWHRYMKLNGDSGARADRIAIKDSTFFDMPIKTPVNIKEQVLIGETLEKFNQYITLHQRKLNNLKLKKKALLQKLFPKNGERYPELRFPGFTDAWEQRKLDDIAKIKTGGGTPKTTNLEYWSGDIPWIQSSDLVEGDVVHVNIKKFINNNALKNSAAKLISRDSIALVTRVGVGKVAVINQDFTTSQDFLSLSGFDGNDIKFIAYQLFRLMQENAKVLQGTSIKGITKTDLIEQSIAIPNSIKEQSLIANILSQTDSIITLHQRKLDHLQLQKKALLQQMFI